jgi:hypothetical protein
VAGKATLLEERFDVAHIVDARSCLAERQQRGDKKNDPQSATCVRASIRRNRSHGHIISVSVDA